MYLFILESIGTSELLLIGVVALIVFGPRKLPQMAKMLGKTMADFRRTTNDFKSTWEKEVNFEETGNQNNNSKPVEYPIERETKQISDQNSILSPEIKEVNPEDLNKFLESQNKEKVIQTEPRPQPQANDKRSWL